MRAHTGVAAQMFKSLADAGVNILMITTSEIKISVLVNRDQSLAALNAVHQGFGLDKESGVAPSVGFRQSDDSQRAAINRDELEQDVVSKLAGMEDIVVSEIDLDTRQSRVTIRGISDQPGVAAEVFAVSGR